jgi:NAD(P)-dependent dehydrogenase (short-subunit alcohol dehydrogenase family)
VAPKALRAAKLLSATMTAMAQLDMFSLQGRVALVPGGGGGIGTPMAEALAQAGARVAVAGRSAETLEAAVERVAAAGSEGLAITADATSEDDAERMVRETIDRFGRIDIVVNAVGGGAGKVLHPAEEYPRDAWDWIMELNVRSTLVPTQAAARAMIAAGNGGAILNITSVRALLGINAGYSAYVAAKGAIASLTRQWATEWAKHGIRVNAIMPTFVDTPQVATLLGDPDFKAGIVNRIPLGRVGETRDIVGPAIFLVSDAASFVTGQVLGIDGGLTATQ